MAPTVLITGASQGSGKATALLFASKGYDVVMVARQPERLAAAAAQVQREGTSAVGLSRGMLATVNKCARSSKKP